MTVLNQHVRFEELAVGHALTALEPEDEQAFLAHLHGCARCEQDLAEHRATLAHLAYAPEPAEPPASLLEGIRAGVLASGRGASFPAAVDDTEAVPAPAAMPDPTLLEVARRRREAGRLRRVGTWSSIAAAAALVVGLGTWNASLQSDRQQQDAWGSRISAAISQLGEPGVDPVALSGNDGQVVAVALLHGDQVALLVDGLAPNDSTTSTYVLWGQSRFGDVRAVAAFDVTGEQLDVRQGLELKAGVSDVTTFKITREQGRTIPPIARGELLASGEV